MLFAVNKNTISQVLKSCRVVANNKNSMPILQTVLIETVEQNAIKITATNLEITIVETIYAKVEDPGKLTVPIKTLIDSIAASDNEALYFKYSPKTQNLSIKTKRSQTTIKCLDPDEYPPVKDPESFTQIYTDKLGQLTKKLLFMNCYARDFNRPVLQAINIASKNGFISMASADGYRLSHDKIQSDNVQNFEVNVYAHQLLQILKSIDLDQDFVYSIDDRIVLLQCENLSIYMLQVEGRYPDIEAVIPQHVNPTLAYVNAKDINKLISRSMVFARDNANSITMVFEENEIIVIGRSNERGDTEGSINASIKGESKTISINGMFVNDILSTLDETVVFEVNNADQAIKLYEDSSTLRYILMPMSR